MSRGKAGTTLCHPDRKHYAHGLCRPCYGNTRKEHNEKYRNEHKEEQKERAADWYKENKEQATLRINRRRLRLIGWTPELVEAHKEEQHNCCAICEQAFLKTPNADHKHVQPPIPRGLLCSFCNTALGLFQDSPAILRKAADYIEKY